MHVVYGGVTASHPGDPVQTRNNLAADVQVERVFGRLIQQIRRLGKLRTQRVEGHVGRSANRHHITEHVGGKLEYSAGASKKSSNALFL